MAQTITTDQLNRLVELYIGYFNRAPEKAGLDFWSNTLSGLLAEGKSEGEAMAFIADQFYTAGVEYKLYDPKMSSSDFILLAYKNVLGRDLDAEPAAQKEEALTYWGTLLDNKDISQGEFILRLIDAAKAYKDDPNWSWVPKYLDARTEAGVLFAQSELGNITDPAKAIAQGQSVLAGLSADTFKSNPNADPATVAQQVFNDWTSAQLGQTFTLTTGVDTITGTQYDDTITGTVSAVKTEGTFNPTDQIDGGAGKDTLKVTLKTNFGGMSGDGYVKNVETIDITNASTIGRTFTATGITGAQHYVLNGAVSLDKLATTTADVTLKNVAGGNTITLGYADKVTDGKADTQAIILDTVGTPASGSTDAKPATVKLAAGIETVSLTAQNDNFVTLDASGATALDIAGAGTLTLDLSGSGALKTIDGSLASGALTLDLTSGAGIKSVATGSGDDTITAGSGSLVINATVDGGAGNDTLKLSGSIGTTAYTMSDIETLILDSATVVFSAQNVSGLETVVMKGSSSGSFSKLGNADLTVKLDETSSGSALTLDNGGATTIEVLGGTKDSAKTSAAAVTLTNSADLTVQVDAYGTLAGTLTANKAQSFTLTGDGAVSGATLAVGAATSGTIDLTGNSASSLTLDAGKLTNLSVATAADLTLSGSGANSLAAVQNLTVDTDGKFDASGAAFTGAATVTLSGTGSVELGQLGSTSNDYGLSVSANGLSGLTLGNLEVGTGNAISLDLSGIMGDVSGSNMTADSGNITVTADVQGSLDLGTLTAKSITVDAHNVTGRLTVSGASGDTVKITGSELAENKITVTAGQSATVVGGLGDDTITIGGSGSAVLTGGLGNDEFIIASGAGTKVDALMVKDGQASGANGYGVLSAGDTIDLSALLKNGVVQITDFNLNGESGDKIDLSAFATSSGPSSTPLALLADGFSLASGAFTIADGKYALVYLDNSGKVLGVNDPDGVSGTIAKTLVVYDGNTESGSADTHVIVVTGVVDSNHLTTA